MMERPRPQSKVSLEDLLRLKRAERPALEFWAEFEGQLRRKQLAAIVDRRPWWRRLSTASLAKISIPVGATAVIAFTLVTVRERAQPAPDMATVAAASVNAESSASSVISRAIESSAADTGGSAIASADLVNVPVSQTSFSATSLVNAPVSSGSSAEGNGTTVVTHDLPEPSLAQVILGLESTTESDARSQFQSDATPLLASLDILESGRSQEISSMEGLSLSQISAPRDSRRARLLASVDSQEHGDLVSGNSRVARSRERIASRLAEQSLYDSISRLGLNADSVSIKF